MIPSFRLGLVASIYRKSNGSVTAPYYDTVGATVSMAVGVRRLIEGYTGPLMRVRRSSDNTEQDFYCATGSNLLDTAALLAFCGSGDGRVHYLYPQDGTVAEFLAGTKNGMWNDSTDTQPYVVQAGALCKQLVGGKEQPVVRFTATLFLQFHTHYGTALDTFYNDWTQTMVLLSSQVGGTGAWYGLPSYVYGERGGTTTDFSLVNYNGRYAYGSGASGSDKVYVGTYALANGIFRTVQSRRNGTTGDVWLKTDLNAVEQNNNTTNAMGTGPLAASASTVQMGGQGSPVFDLVEWVVWPSVLSDAQMDTIAAIGMTRQDTSSLSPHTTALYHLDSDMLDSTGLSTLANNSASPGVQTTVYKFNGGCLSNVSNNGYSTITGDFFFGQGAYCIEMWSRRTRTGDSGFLWDLRSSTYGTNEPCFLASGDAPQVNTGDGTNVYGTAGTYGVDGLFHHCVVSRDDLGVVRCFLDGVMFASRTDVTAVNCGTMTLFAAQYYPPGAQPMQGYIDEIRVYKGAPIYTANFTPPTAPYTK